MKIWQDDKNRLKAKTESGPSGWTVKERGSHWLKVSPAVADDLSLLSFLPEPAANVGQDGFSPLQERAKLLKGSQKVQPGLFAPRKVKSVVSAFLTEQRFATQIIVLGAPHGARG